jgi:hypothetical protein
MLLTTLDSPFQKKFWSNLVLRLLLQIKPAKVVHPLLRLMLVLALLNEVVDASVLALANEVVDASALAVPPSLSPLLPSLLQSLPNRRQPGTCNKTVPGITREASLENEGK